MGGGVEQGEASPGLVVFAVGVEIGVGVGVEIGVVVEGGGWGRGSTHRVGRTQRALNRRHTQRNSPPPRTWTREVIGCGPEEKAYPTLIERPDDRPTSRVMVMGSRRRRRRSVRVRMVPNPRVPNPSAPSLVVPTYPSR